MRNYHSQVRRVGTTGRTTPKKAKRDPSRAVQEATLALPDIVSVAVREFTGELEEGLLAFVVGSGLKVVNAMLEHEVEIPVGPKGHHGPNRVALSYGREDGVVTLAGRPAQITRPRMRSVDRTSEVALSTDDCFASTQLLWRMAMEKMLTRDCIRRYGAGLKPVIAAVEARSRGTSRSALSWRFVAATETALAEPITADLALVDFACLMIDGLNFAGH